SPAATARRSSCRRFSRIRPGGSSLRAQAKQSTRLQRKSGLLRRDAPRNDDGEELAYSVQHLASHPTGDLAWTRSLTSTVRLCRSQRQKSRSSIAASFLPTVKDIVNAPPAKAGIGVITVPDIRWSRRDIKSVALLAQVLAKQAAAEAGAGEAWMIEDGKVTEGGSSSAFILTQDDVLVTRQNGSEILPGCTRKAVVALAEERQLRVEERAFSVEEALAAKEAFITSATLYVQPVISIDGKTIANG